MDSWFSECGNVFNEDIDCDRWAMQGECQLNRDWMSTNCAESCGLCDVRAEMNEPDEIHAGWCQEFQLTNESKLQTRLMFS